MHAIESTLLKANQNFAVRLMQHLVTPTFVIDPEHRVIIWNRACERLTGVPASEVLGTTEHWRAFYDTPRQCLADILLLDHHANLYQLYAAHVPQNEENKGFLAENWCVMPRLGNKLYLAIDAGPIYDDDGHLIAVVETLRDMTTQKVAEMALHDQARRDALTGVANRRLFDETLEHEWHNERHASEPLSLLLADIDYFKLYNDSYGHQQGDECLRQIGRTLITTVFRPTDLVARYGGEEFAIILPATDSEAAVAVAERLLAAVADQALAHRASGVADHVTLSIGVATLVPAPQTTPAQLIAQTDAALYEAKHSGRNRVVRRGAVTA